MFLSMHFTELIKNFENFWNERSLNNHDQLEIDHDFRTWPGKVQIERANKKLLAVVRFCGNNSIAS